MTSTWLTPQAHERLRTELTTLLADGQDQLTNVRVRRLRELLDNAVVGQDPPDDGIAEPGMVLTVRYEDTGDVETFLLGVRDLEHQDIEVYSPTSPLGTALAGARPGEARGYAVPSGATVRVTLLDAVPYGRHRS